VEISNKKLREYTDKIVKSLEHKTLVKQVDELHKVVKEIWKDGKQNKNGIREVL
jgi:hypothetical protein